jgi:HAD superfamily hydrolase (TIGR01509 family)
MKKLEFDAVIFDLDGTLIDSMWVWRKIDVDFLTKRGLDAPPDYFMAVSSLGFRETANYTIERFALNESADDMMREWSDMALFEYENNVYLKPYVREYLELLKASGVKLGIATSSPGELCYPALENNAIRDFFDVICPADGSARGKEFPDIFIHSAEKLSVRPASCLVFDDILQAIRSAKLAGMLAWGVYDDSSKDLWEEIKKTADGFLYDFKDAPQPTKTKTWGGAPGF